MPANFTPEEEAFIRAQRVARLATADASGQPFAVPIVFTLLRGFLYTAIDEKPKSGRPLRRLRNIEENPRVAVIVDRYDDDWSQLAWVLIRGKTAIVTDGAEKSDALAGLREKYPQYESMALEDKPLIQIEPEGVSSWGAL
ncbi:MAG TPA: TIGR03668 family PPOX class F420-dependent oxidoreductase [Dehalococcoidia bacterium]|nr:TIGR03668 family PPOX class F420-dependent oxidoreductase [Dehalococcoidia bacterium]